MRLWVDDQRNPPEGWDWARGFMEAVNKLLTGEVVELALDHDLGEHEPTGYDLIRWVAHHRPDLWPQVVSSHSANPPGRQNIIETIEHSGLYKLNIDGKYERMEHGRGQTT